MRKIYFDAGTHRNRICLVDPINSVVLVKKLGNRLKPNSTLFEWIAFEMALKYARGNVNGEKIEFINDSKLVMKSKFLEYERKDHTPMAKVRNLCSVLYRNLSKKTEIKLSLVNRKRNLAGNVLDAMRKLESPSKSEQRKNKWKVNYYIRDDRKSINYKLKLNFRGRKRKLLPNDIKCPKCNQQNKIVRQGARYTNQGRIQRYWCKRCSFRFIKNNDYKHHKFRPEIIKETINLWGLGLSTRQISNHFEKTTDVKVSHATISKWIKKFYLLKNFGDYEEAKKWARNTGIKTEAQWRSAWERGEIPKNFPRDPNRVYN